MSLRQVHVGVRVVKHERFRDDENILSEMPRVAELVPSDQILNHVRLPTMATPYQAHAERWLGHVFHPDDCLLDFFPKVLDLKFI